MYKKHTDFVEELCARSQVDDDILCYGDFNLPNLKWEFDYDEDVVAKK